MADAADRSRLCEGLADRGFVVLAEAGDLTSTVAAAELERPDICLVDLDLPGNPLAAVGQIAKGTPMTTVVVLAAAARPAEMIAALERGASGYLLKEIAPDELAKTLRAALRGEPALARALVPYLIEHVRRGSRRRLALPGRAVALTPREWDVAELVEAGLATEEIASSLGISSVTVRRHISSLLKKCGAENRDALAAKLRLFA
jgi:DNA-binding NarL/FixJ family response regulator